MIDQNMGKIFQIPLQKKDKTSVQHTLWAQVLAVVLGISALIGVPSLLGLLLQLALNAAIPSLKLSFWQGLCLFLGAQILLFPCYLILGKQKNGNGTSGLS